MKKIFTPLFFLLTIGFTQAQNILFVNDNDAITANTTTMLTSLNSSSYATYTYWSIPDSTTTLTSAYMDNFDLVIWYCSTDGVGLEIWGGSATGNAEVVNYINSGKAFWLIGLDIMYQQYAGGPSTFASGDFAYDQLGLQSYDSQSYLNDGSLGVDNVVKMAGVPASFPATIQWVFSSLWYVDGCTALGGTMSMYEMGGVGTYPLLGSDCMFHKNDLGGNVMSTFFDPALIDTEPNRIDFLDESITYLLNGVGIQENNFVSGLTVAPNPVKNSTSVRFNLLQESSVSYSLYTINGSLVKSQSLGKLNGENTIQIDLGTVESGMYFLTLTTDQSQQFIKLIKD